MNLLPFSEGCIADEVSNVVLDIVELDFNHTTSRDDPLYDKIQILINFIHQLSQKMFSHPNGT